MIQSPPGQSLVQAFAPYEPVSSPARIRRPKLPLNPDSASSRQAVIIETICPLASQEPLPVMRMSSVSAIFPSGRTAPALISLKVGGMYGGTVSRWVQRHTFGISFSLQPQVQRRFCVPSPTSYLRIRGILPDAPPQPDSRRNTDSINSANPLSIPLVESTDRISLNKSVISI